MEEVCLNNELYHHGIKNMKWGIRRFQNKDGSLTPAGKKRYDKEVAKLKAEKKKLRNEISVQKKADKLKQLEKERDALKVQSKKLKKNSKTTTQEDKQAETIEQKRERLLKSTDAKELYENRALLTKSELDERINRIDTEAKLKSKIVVEKRKTGMEKFNERMSKATDTIGNAVALYQKVDNAYSTFSKSSIGKSLAKKLGIEQPKKEFNIDEIWKKRNKLSDEDLKKAAQRAKSVADLKRNMDTLSGKGNGKNNSGMSESDVEELVSRLLDERENSK